MDDSSRASGAAADAPRVCERQLLVLLAQPLQFGTHRTGERLHFEGVVAPPDDLERTGGRLGGRGPVQEGFAAVHACNLKDLRGESP